MPTGGDGTAYMGEAAVSQQQQKFMGMVYAYFFYRYAFLIK